MRENRELEQQNLRLSHRVAFLEDHCSSLKRGLRSVAVSVESCLNLPRIPLAAPPTTDRSRYIQALLSLVELLHYCARISRELHSDASQLSYAIKNQLKAQKAPN